MTSRTGAGVWRSRPLLPILLAALLVVLVFLVAAVVQWADRVQTLAVGHRTAATRALLLQEQTARSFQAVDLTLVGIADALRVAPSLPEHDPVFEDTLRRKRDALPCVRALFVIGVDGYITHTRRA